MNRITLIYYIATCISIVSASVGWLTLNETHPDHPNKCYYEGPPELVMDIKTKKRIPGECGAYTCFPGFSIRAEYCGAVGNHGHCKRIEGNPSSPYPHCCPEYSC